MYDIIIIFAILYYILSLLNINTLLILLILFIISPRYLWRWKCLVFTDPLPLSNRIGLILGLSI